MISKDVVVQAVNQFLKDKEDYFLVDVTISIHNTICVEIDAFQGVGVETCCELSRFIETKIDREIEDFELEVGSAGITAPFKILQQYIKNINNEVEVLLKNGKKIIGFLRSANEHTFVVEVSQKIKKDKNAKKEEVTELLTYAYSDVKHTKYNLRFK